VLFATGAYLVWGFFPIYFKLLKSVPPVEILSHRVIWSVVLLGLVVSLRGEVATLRRLAAAPRTLAIYVVATVLLAANWLVYIWGVNAGFVVETSLGYFMNPLVNVLLGVLILRERLRPLQILPISIAAIGVIYLTISYGRLPWIALFLATSFGLYGLVKKTAPLNSLHSLALETGLLLIPALAYLGWLGASGQGAFIQQGPTVTLLLCLAGVVTSVPLLLFGAGARAINLTTLGLLQYIAPTCQFILGVFVYDEPFTNASLVGFGIIWLALLLYTFESLSHNLKRVEAPV
jgi:chloramphenicol-sensitive protein RarD